MLVGHDYAVNTDLSVLGVTNLGELKAGSLVMICAVAGLEESCYTGRSARGSGSVTFSGAHAAGCWRANDQPSGGTAGYLSRA
jgi:hypothetical protein